MRNTTLFFQSRRCGGRLVSNWIPTIFVAAVALLAVVFTGVGTCLADGPADSIQSLISTMMECGRMTEPSKNESGCTDEQIENNLALGRLAEWLMGPNWTQLNESQKDDFVNLLRRLLRELAYTQAAKFLKDTQFEYGPAHVKGNEALVDVTIIKPDEGRMHIGFRLNRTADVWKIWDVRLDGVSVASNLRKQVQSIMGKHSYEELVNRMQKKIDTARLP